MANAASAAPNPLPAADVSCQVSDTSENSLPKTRYPCATSSACYWPAVGSALVGAMVVVAAVKPVTATTIPATEVFVLLLIAAAIKTVTKSNAIRLITDQQTLFELAGVGVALMAVTGGGMSVGCAKCVCLIHFEPSQ